MTTSNTQKKIDGEAKSARILDMKSKIKWIAICNNTSSDIIISIIKEWTFRIANIFEAIHTKWTPITNGCSIISLVSIRTESQTCMIEEPTSINLTTSCTLHR